MTPEQVIVDQAVQISTLRREVARLQAETFALRAQADHTEPPAPAA